MIKFRTNSPINTDEEDGGGEANILCFSPKRIFLNCLDSYHGLAILKKLVTLKDPEEPEEDKSVKSAYGEGASTPRTVPKKLSYQFVGLAKDPVSFKVMKLTDNYLIINKDEVLRYLPVCGVVIIDITSNTDDIGIAHDYMKLMEEILPKVKDAELNYQKRYFILISTIMTWAFTKPIDPEAPEEPLVETNFRKRKPHPNYKIQYNIENEVLTFARKFKDKMKALVLTSGMTYGEGEDVLYYWFQKAWECEKFIPILERGRNVIPMINVNDLATIVLELVKNFPIKLYILAVESYQTQQREIIKALAKHSGTGLIKFIPKEAALLIDEITQRTYDYMNVNLIMAPAYVTDNIVLEEVPYESFADAVPTLMKQYKKVRKLKPFKVIIHGPPGSGKTTLAKQICKTYGLIYLSPETIVDYIIEDLEWRVKEYEDRVAKAEDEQEDEEETVDEESGFTAADNKRLLSLLILGGPPDDAETITYMRRVLSSNEALNKGWVLDGYPETLPQCQILFEKSDGDEEEPDEVDDDMFDEDKNLYDHVMMKFLPYVVVTLEVSDEAIYSHIMRLPEDVIRNTRLEEEIIHKRLEAFRLTNTHDTTPLNFFDELDIHPLVLDVTHDDSTLSKAYIDLCLRLGPPCCYGALKKYIEILEKKEAEEQKAKIEKLEFERKTYEEMMLKERQDKMEYWTEVMSSLREEEEAILAAKSEPLRRYLVNHVLPTLSVGLLEVAKVRPEDPIDFLAEYLFRSNPSGKMLEPGYNLQAEKLLNRIVMLDETMSKLNIIIPHDAC